MKWFLAKIFKKNITNPE